MNDIQVLPLKVEAMYEGKKFVMEKDLKARPVQGNAYTATIADEWCHIVSDEREIRINATHWKLTLPKPSKHPLYFPIITLIRALKGETD